MATMMMMMTTMTMMMMTTTTMMITTTMMDGDDDDDDDDNIDHDVDNDDGDGLLHYEPTSPKHVVTQLEWFRQLFLTSVTNMNAYLPIRNTWNRSTGKSKKMGQLGNTWGRKQKLEFTIKFTIQNLLPARFLSIDASQKKLVARIAW